MALCRFSLLLFCHVFRLITTYTFKWYKFCWEGSGGGLSGILFGGEMILIRAFAGQDPMTPPPSPGLASAGTCGTWPLCLLMRHCPIDHGSPSPNLSHILLKNNYHFNCLYSLPIVTTRSVPQRKPQESFFDLWTAPMNSWCATTKWGRANDDPKTSLRSPTNFLPVTSYRWRLWLP